MRQLIDKLKIEHALELICQQGCPTVRETIREIECGALSEPMKKLNTEECARLLVDLKSVMKTYL